jgi:hypothetical protein
MKTINTMIIASAILASVSYATANVMPQDAMNHGQDKMTMGQMQMMDLGKTGTFKGVEVNAGTASLYKMNNKYHLKWSDDFKIPGTPAPSWQIIDAKGNVYLLNQLKVAGDKQNRDIIIPSYIKSVAKIQIWCSFAEVNLGEASFKKAININ